MMRFHLIRACLLILVSWASVTAQSNASRPRANALDRPPLEDMIEGLYVSRFQEELGLNEEQFSKMLPAIRQNLRERREFAARRARALARLRQLLQQGASEEELRSHLREVDRAEADAASRAQSLYSKLDPMLSATQQAKLRVFEFAIDQRLRRMIDQARSPATPRRPNRNF